MSLHLQDAVSNTFAGCDVPPCRDACNASASCDNVNPPVSCADLGEVLPGVQVSSCAWCAGAPHVLGEDVTSAACGELPSLMGRGWGRGFCMRPYI